MATLTVYPDPHTESTSVDGYVDCGAVQNPWSLARNHAGGGSDDVGVALYILHASFSAAEYFCRRVICLFDTSALTGDATISAATVSLYRTSGGADFGSGCALNITSATPASNTALANSDFATANFGTTRFVTGDTAYASFAAAGNYTDFVLNASGLAAISLIGVTKLAFRADLDIDNTTPTAGSYLEMSSADVSGTSQDPKLVITYTVPGGGGDLLLRLQGEGAFL